MKVQVNRVEFLTLLEKLKPAVPNRSTLPICTSVLLKAEGRKLTITANNLEYALVGECKAKVGDPGAICLEFAKLFAFLKGTKGEVVTIEAKTPLSVVITSNGSSLTTKGQSAEDFPPVPEVQGEKVLAYNLAEALGKVAYCMATEDTRPVLQAVDFRPNDPLGSKCNVVKLATADGFRLAVAPLKVKGSLVEMIVPSAVVLALKKLMPGNVTITQKLEPGRVDQGNEPAKSYAVTVSFEQKGLKLVCMLVQGTYPNYIPLIPNDTTHAVTVERDAMAEALKTVWTGKNRTGSNIIRMHTTKGKLLLNYTEDDDKYEATVPCQGTMKIALNGKYLSDLLRHVDDKITLRTTVPSAPVKVISQGVVNIISPMFVQWEEEPKKPRSPIEAMVDRACGVPE